MFVLIWPMFKIVMQHHKVSAKLYKMNFWTTARKTQVADTWKLVTCWLSLTSTLIIIELPSFIYQNNCNEMYYLILYTAFFKNCDNKWRYLLPLFSTFIPWFSASIPQSLTWWLIQSGRIIFWHQCVPMIMMLEVQLKNAISSIRKTISNNPLPTEIAAGMGIKSLPQYKPWDTVTIPTPFP